MPLQSALPAAASASVPASQPVQAGLQPQRRGEAKISETDGERSSSTSTVQIQIEVKLETYLTRSLVGNQAKTAHTLPAAAFWDGDNAV